MVTNEMNSFLCIFEMIYYGRENANVDPLDLRAGPAASLCQELIEQGAPLRAHLSAQIIRGTE